MAAQNILRLLHSGIRANSKTANYTVVAADNFSILTNRGAAGAVVFTLPAAAKVGDGFSVMFFCVVNQDFKVSATAGEMVTFNNAAATSVSLQTTAKRIGGSFLAVSDGTSWLMFNGCEETQTVTVA